jgi:hypothetical protein
MPPVQTALYYPYIHIRSEHWLKATLLCVPVVKRIVPETYTPEDRQEIVRYTKIEGPHGHLLQTVSSYSPAADEAQHRLLERLRQHEDEIVAQFTRARAPVPDEYWVHDAKFNGSMIEYLRSKDLAWSSEHDRAFGHRNWYALHPRLGSALMTTLGLSIAREQRLDIVTDSGEYHEALIANREDAIFEALLARADASNPEGLERRRQVAEMVIALSGINLKALRPEDLPELHASPSFQVFQDQLRKAAAAVESTNNPEAFRNQLEREAGALVEAWNGTRFELAREVKEAVPDVAKPLAAGLGGMLLGAAVNPVVVGVGAAVGLLFRTVKAIRQLPEGQRQFLTHVERQQDDAIRLQFPLGLER